MLVRLNDRELAAVLTGLRMLQAQIDDGAGSVTDWVHEILTEGGTLAPMTGDELDVLCDHINTGGEDTRLLVTVSNEGEVELYSALAPDLEVVVAHHGDSGSEQHITVNTGTPSEWVFRGAVERYDATAEDAPFVDLMFGAAD